MQKLYEQHKALTYPRTDSRVLSSDIVPTLKDRVKAASSSGYSRAASKLMKKEWKLPKSVVDNKQVTDHHAIIPTEESVSMADLNDKERKIYDLVVKRFLAVLSDPHEYEQMTVEAQIGNEHFTAKGKNIKKQSWKELYNDGEAANVQLPDVQEGATSAGAALKLTTGETKPPERFTEGALLQAMENPARYMEQDDKHLTKTIHKAGGIGTVATRADIIEKLFNSQLMELRGKYIYTTSKGRQLLDLVPEELRSPALTAEWEDKLARIEAGKLTKSVLSATSKRIQKKLSSRLKRQRIHSNTII